MVGIAEAFALLFLGLTAGVIAAVFDVAAIGSASFIAHFSLWVLFNTLVTIHVDRRLKAIWWAIPFNLGYLESYYLCTSASFEGYMRSLMAPLALIALASPLLTYALWTAKRDRGPYGKILSILIAAGVVGTGYYILGTYDVFTIVVAVLVLILLLFWPARRLRFTPAPRPPEPYVEEQIERPSSRRGSSRRLIADVPSVEDEPLAQDLGPSERRPSERRSSERRSSERRPSERRSSERRSSERRSSERRPTQRGTRRRTTATTLRRNRSREDERDAQRRAAAQRRARRQREREREERGLNAYAPLGTSRSPRPSTRGRRF